jgi:hypothetical protein
MMAKTLHIEVDLYLNPDDAEAAGVNPGTVFEVLRRFLADHARAADRSHLCVHSRVIEYDQQEPRL